MEVSAIASTMIAMQQSLLASNLQMALLKSTAQADAAAMATLLETAMPSNPAHLGNLIDTTA
jgi:hypothetical protein